MAVDVLDLAKSHPIRTLPSSRVSQNQYSFKDEYTITIFNLLVKKNMLKLAKVKCFEEIGKIDDSNYCLYHRIINHSIKNYILKGKIQVLVDANAVKLLPEQKKVTTTWFLFSLEKPHIE